MSTTIVQEPLGTTPANQLKGGLKSRHLTMISIAGSLVGHYLSALAR